MILRVKYLLWYQHVKEQAVLRLARVESSQVGGSKWWDRGVGKGRARNDITRRVQPRRCSLGTDGLLPAGLYDGAIHGWSSGSLEAALANRWCGITYVGEVIVLQAIHRSLRAGVSAKNLQEHECVTITVDLPAQIPGVGHNQGRQWGSRSRRKAGWHR